MKKDKINLALLWSNYGGNVTSVNDLVLGLDKQRFNAIFIYLTGYGVDKNLIEEAGYEVFYLSNIKLINAFRFSILFRLVGILKKHNVDILHCHGHKPSFYGTFAAMIAKTPVVLTHVHGLGRSRNFRRKLANFLLFRKISRIIPVANSVKDDVLKNNWSVPAEKLSVLENSIDFERFANVQITKQQAKQNIGLKANSFVFGAVGRMDPTKGQTYLIRAFEKAKEALPLVQLILIGDGRLRNELEQQVAETPYADSIHFLGHRDNVPELLKAIDTFVFPSIAEGMPFAVLEAMAAGVPCITTKVGGIPEIITDNETGLLVPQRDSAALAKAMISVANMPNDKLKRFTKNAQNRVRQFYSHEIVREKLRKLYESDFEASVKSRCGSTSCQE